ncbi:YybH family protein [Congregibacter sp.]|uniref:YybH family protein n=1 Tax=Congregibacter sp. TaxID=2744308 RepID=UPI00385B556B
MKAHSNFSVLGATQLVLTTLLTLCLGSVAQLAAAQDKSPEDERAVASVIMSLQKTWNSGDMSGYLALYQQDDSLRLTFGNTVVEGWSALDSLFRKSYPDPLRMGRFTVDRVDVQILSQDAAVAYGNFTHVFPKETIKGGFSHVLTQNASGNWIIRHERTSRGEVIETH